MTAITSYELQQHFFDKEFRTNPTDGKKVAVLEINVSLLRIQEDTSLTIQEVMQAVESELTKPTGNRYEYRGEITYYEVNPTGKNVLILFAIRAYKRQAEQIMNQAL